MRRRAALVGAMIAAMVVAAAGPAGAAPGRSFRHLNPGGKAALTETVPVNVVFVGYEPEQVDRSSYLSRLARSYEPVVRSRLWYGETERLGIKYTYDYQVKYADSGYENRFFGQLTSLATPAPLTLYQEAYNEQAGRTQTIADNHYIDAPSVEKWLAYHPPAGVDTTRNTIFFINWWGRADFEHHVYTKIGEPDPDTGHDFGELSDSRKIIAWGGTTADDEETGLGSTRRVWFHDLSAGPDAWGAGYDITNADVDGDGVADRRMPPTWEYAANGNKLPAELAPDLGDITRYVALDLLMTTSPLYPAELPTPEPPKTINVDSNTYEWWPGVDASDEYLKPELVVQELSELRWRNVLDTDEQTLPADDKAVECYDYSVSCYPETGLPGAANLYLYNWENLERTKDDGDSVDYELPVFNYAVPDELGSGPPALGYADDDWATGTQTGVFCFISPGIVESGYGLTTTQIHEVGHHLGMSHPHDGYDSASGVDFGPSGDYFFAWFGDEHNSMMSYIDLNWDFSQFDRDNSDRFLTAAYVEATNRLAADVISARGTSMLGAADDALGQAAAAFARHDYRRAYAYAEKAYDLAADAASRAGADPGAAAKSLAAEAAAARSSSKVHEPHEFLDTLQPGGPRTKP